MRLKLKFLTFGYCVLFLGLIVRLFYWQVIKAGDLSRQAMLQYSSGTETRASRGNILSADGSFWALNSDSWTIYANTRVFDESAKVISQKLALLFVSDQYDRKELLDESMRLEGLLLKDGAYIPLKTRVQTSLKKNVEALKIKGIGFENNEVRYYPEASTSAHLLGFVGKEESGGDIGYFGLEGYYNLPLSGKSGFTLRQKDAGGAPILLDPSKSISATSGVDLVTNVDKRIQLLIEDKLKMGVEKYGASSGSITIMDPHTGSILGLANYPSYDPAKYWEFTNSLFKNSAVSDTFEPGSIFKVLVMASGLDAGVIEPDTKCDICGEPLKIDKYFIKTWNNKYENDITMTEVIVHSDNVGMSFIGQRMGADKMYEYLSRFGIGSPTGVDVQGEAAVPLRKKGTWNIVDLATSSFGQGVVVTGIQMVRAVSAIANGGYLVTPQVVDKISGEGWEEKIKREKPSRIISEKAARETTEMMVQAVDNGEAKWTRVPDFKVAGKTGTAQIAVGGQYDAENTNHSFIGFAPADKPKFVMLVTLKSPQSSPWASETAAPLWFDISKELFPYLGIAPSR
jgi:cell division protein FtsI/penicillin-binding protein 2